MKFYCLKFKKIGEGAGTYNCKFGQSEPTQTNKLTNKHVGSEVSKEVLLCFGVQMIELN